MSSVLRELTPESRRTLALCLESGRVAPPFSELMLERYVGAERAGAVTAELERLTELGATPAVLREMLLLAGELPEVEPPSLVWSGPEDAASETRDTGVVLRELFGSARTKVLVAGFAIHQGRAVFEVLAARMDAQPALDVRMYLNIARGYGDTTDASELLRRFAERFRDEEWSGARLPAVFYDPRALALHEKGDERAALHAKCLVVDGVRLLVTSANFTEAAQERNIEVGAMFRSPSFARALEAQFERLVAAGHLRRLPGL